MDIEVYLTRLHHAFAEYGVTPEVTQMLEIVARKYNERQLENGELKKKLAHEVEYIRTYWEKLEKIADSIPETPEPYMDDFVMPPPNAIVFRTDGGNTYIADANGNIVC